MKQRVLELSTSAGISEVSVSDLLNALSKAEAMAPGVGGLSADEDLPAKSLILGHQMGEAPAELRVAHPPVIAIFGSAGWGKSVAIQHLLASRCWIISPVFHGLEMEKFSDRALAVADEHEVIIPHDRDLPQWYAHIGRLGWENPEENAYLEDAKLALENLTWPSSESLREFQAGDIVTTYESLSFSLSETHLFVKEETELAPLSRARDYVSRIRNLIRDHFPTEGLVRRSLLASFNAREVSTRSSGLAERALRDRRRSLVQHFPVEEEFWRGFMYDPVGVLPTDIPFDRVSPSYTNLGKSSTPTMENILGTLKEIEDGLDARRTSALDRFSSLREVRHYASDDLGFVSPVRRIVAQPEANGKIQTAMLIADRFAELVLEFSLSSGLDPKVGALGEGLSALIEEDARAVRLIQPGGRLPSNLELDIGYFPSWDSQTWAKSPLLKPVRDAYETGAPVPFADGDVGWIQLHRLPQFVYFNHSIHIDRGVSCNKCHGSVQPMIFTDFLRQTRGIPLSEEPWKSMSNVGDNVGECAGMVADNFGINRAILEGLLVSARDAWRVDFHNPYTARAVSILFALMASTLEHSLNRAFQQVGAHGVQSEIINFVWWVTVYYAAMRMIGQIMGSTVREDPIKVFDFGLGSNRLPAENLIGRLGWWRLRDRDHFRGHEERFWLSFCCAQSMRSEWRRLFKPTCALLAQRLRANVAACERILDRVFTCEMVGDSWYSSTKLAMPKFCEHQDGPQTSKICRNIPGDRMMGLIGGGIR